MTSIRDLDRAIRERHLLRHPFYVAWSSGNLPMATLREYAGQYYHFEANFPRYVGATYARLGAPADRRVLLDNLIDEEGRSPTHPELWVDFGRGIGMRPSAVRDAPPGTATRRLCRNYDRWTLEGSAASGLGALYAYESIFPEVAAEKSRGLRELYGIRAPSAHEFFRVHSVADVQHSEAERRLLRRAMAGSPRAQQQAERAVRATVGAWWSFLDAFPVEC
jgi:pyrroloquinoline-quinone synthase